MPNNWKTYKLGDVCSKITDGAHHSPKAVGINGYPMPSVKDLTPFGLNLESSKKISELDYNKLVKQGCQPEVNDVVIAKDGNTALDTVCVIKKKVEAVLLSSVAILRPDLKFINPYFLKCYFSSPIILTYLKSRFISGAAIPRVILKDFKLAEITLPPLPEQKAITSILSALDDKIENNLALNKTLEDMAMALYKHWFVEFGPFQAGNFIDSELGLIPESWDVYGIKNLLEIKPINGLYKSKEYQGEGRRWLKMKSVYSLPIVTNQNMELISVSEKEVVKYGCIHNDLVFGRTSLVLEGIGTCAIIKSRRNEAIFESNLFRIRPNEAKVYSNLLFQYFRSSKGRNEVRKIARQTSAVSITSTDLANIRIALPSIEIQQIPNANIEMYISKIVNNITENQTLTKLRDTLLPKLISGEVRVNDIEHLIKEVS